MKKTVIGRRDRVDLPEFGLEDVEAKVDTGAYSNALHCHHIELKEVNDEWILYFGVLDKEHEDHKGKIFHTKNYSKKIVKSSNGTSEERFVISTRVIVFGKARKIKFSLTDRSNMKYPILLGRRFLSKRYIVNVDRKNISYHRKYEN
jgi:hypothetical protein